jgi:thiosulfate/3-mercaptopyruvate sulfurtransferase
MKNLLYILVAALFLSFIIEGTYPADKLMEPAVLAKTLNKKSGKKPVVLNVGSVEDIVIKTAIPAGPCSIKQGIAKLNTALTTIKTDQEIVIYCGCCALEHCMNIQPAVDVLVAKGYKKYKILNIKESIVGDWKAKGYPIK